MMNRSKEERDETIVYVGGLHTDVNKEDIESEFQKFGKLLRVWVAFNPPGFAFVEFVKKEEAEAAVKALHDATILGSRLRVEISRGRGRGGRGGGRGGGDRGGRGGFRGGRGSDFGRGSFGSGRPSPYDRNDDVKPFRGRGDMRSRFDDFGGRRPSQYDDRDLGFGARRGGARDFGDSDPPRFGANRDFRDIDTLRGYGDRDIGRRDFPERDLGGRDIGGRDVGGIPPRDIEDRDFPPRNFSRDLGNGRDLRDFGVERNVNGVSRYGGNARDAPFGGGIEVGNTRDFGVSQASIPSRDYGHGAPTRDIGGGRNFVGRDTDEFVGNRDIGTRREPVRDFNPPRDIGDSREFGGRSARGIDSGRFEAGGGFGDRGGSGGFGDRGGPGGFGDRGGQGGFGDRGGQGGFGDRGGQGGFSDRGGPGGYGDRGEPGGFGGGRFSGGNVGGSGDYADYAARDRFRSRSPIGRGRPY